jgi:hypothetical protein
LVRRKRHVGVALRQGSFGKSVLGAIRSPVGVGSSQKEEATGFDEGATIVIEGGLNKHLHQPDGESTRGEPVLQPA